jgi:hypothetical protein
MIFDPRDWDIETEVETGNDDFVFGNYVEWDRFRDENEEELLDYLGVDLPWGKSLTLHEYIDFISQDIFQKTNLIQEYIEDKLLMENTSELLYDISIKFIERNNEVSDNLISNIFDYYGVPSGMEYEYELPEYLRYWQDDFSDFDYDNYKKYPIKVEKYEHTINCIFNDIDSATEQLIKKSLVLSSLIITESMFKSVIVEKIPKDNEISEFGKEIIQSEINNILRGNNEGRNKLFNKLYKKKAPSQNWINLRNSLAHDIESSSIIKDEIKYLNLKTDMEEKYLISSLKQNLIKFCKDLKDIISN